MDTTETRREIYWTALFQTRRCQLLTYVHLEKIQFPAAAAFQSSVASEVYLKIHMNNYDQRPDRLSVQRFGNSSEDAEWKTTAYARSFPQLADQKTYVVHHYDTCHMKDTTAIVMSTTRGGQYLL